MSKSFENKRSIREKFVSTVAAVGIGSTAVISCSSSAQHETPEEQPSVVTELFEADRYQNKIKAPAVRLVDDFISRYQRIREDNGRTVHLEENGFGEYEKVDISATNTADNAEYHNSSNIIGRAESGSVDASHDWFGRTAITLDIWYPGLDERIITLHNDERLAIDFTDLSTLATAVKDEDTVVSKAQIHGSFVDPSFHDATWYTGDPSADTTEFVTTTFKPFDRTGAYIATVELGKMQKVGDSSKPSAPLGVDDVIEWQMDQQ